MLFQHSDNILAFRVDLFLPRVSNFRFCHVQVETKKLSRLYACAHFKVKADVGDARANKFNLVTSSAKMVDIDIYSGSSEPKTA